MRNSTANQPAVAYDRLRILIGRNPNIRVDAGSDGIPAMRCTFHQQRNPRAAALSRLEFPFPGAML